MCYDYREAVKNDILEYITNEINFLDYESMEDLEEFGSGASYLIDNGAEAADVTIRCYLLRECIAAALEEIADEFEKPQHRERWGK